MGDMGRSGGMGLIKNHFTYNINGEEKNISTVVQSFGGHSVVEGDTISDSVCVAATSYSSFGITFVKINYDYYERRSTCYDLVEDEYVDVGYDFLNFELNKCPNIILLSEIVIYDDFFDPRVGDVGINFLAYIIAGVLQVSSKEESLDDIELCYGAVVNKLNKDNNYIKINIDYGDNFHFTKKINLVNKEYNFKNEFDIEIKVKIDKKEGITIEIEDKGIIINIPYEEILYASEKLANKLNEMHSEPWCE